MLVGTLMASALCSTKALFSNSSKDHDPDILSSKKPKLRSPGQAEVDLPEYSENWCSAVKKGYSGTAIYSKVKPLSVTNGFPEDIIKQFKLTGDTYGDPNQEGRVMAAEFDDFIVATVYTPNSKGDLSRVELRHKHWDPAFLAYMKRFKEAGAVLRHPDVAASSRNRPSEPQAKCW